MTETVDLQKTYNNSILKKLSKELGDLNVHSTPRLEKIVNVRRAKTTSQKKDEELLSDLAEGISLISGQKPSIVHAHKSIAGFKLREGDATGLKVTLRKQLMYDFLARLIHIALPRTRDFRGISEKSVDKNGNLTVGVKEASIFPELPSSSFAWGFETTMVTKANGRVDALKLFKELGVPFKK